MQLFIELPLQPTFNVAIISNTIAMQPYYNLYNTVLKLFYRNFIVRYATVIKFVYLTLFLCRMICVVRTSIQQHYRNPSIL